MNSEDLSLKLTIDINILKFWIHLQNLPDDDIAKQCLQLSKDMAEKNQPGISQKIKTLCDEYISRSMILNENNGKTFGTFISRVAQNLSKALINHQLLLLASNRRLNFYTTSKTDTNRTKFLACFTQPTPPSPQSLNRRLDVQRRSEPAISRTTVRKLYLR